MFFFTYNKPAVITIVLLNVFSDIASTNLSNPLPWSIVLQQFTIDPIGWVSYNFQHIWVILNVLIHHP